MHGFRVNRIAYLLVVIGEVLVNEKIKIKGATHVALKAYIERSFHLALNDELVKKRAQDWFQNTNKTLWKCLFSDKKKCVMLKDYIAIINIMEYDYDSYAKAIDTIKESCPSTSDACFIETKSASELDNKYINYLNNQQSFNKYKYYNTIYFEHLAEKEVKINKSNSLCHWQSTQKKL
ncbi:5895_t:CDS:2 [Gigaspora rosea]|nr:5895_t:CDS:2 [Gigaspora rosea]